MATNHANHMAANHANHVTSNNRMPTLSHTAATGRLAATEDVVYVDSNAPIPSFNAAAILKAVVLSRGERGNLTVTLLKSIGFKIIVLQAPLVDGEQVPTPICSLNFAHLKVINYIGRQKLSHSDAWKDWIWIFEDDIVAHPNSNPEFVRQSIIEFMHSKVAKEYSLAYLGACTIMRLKRLTSLRSGLDISKACFLCNHGYGLRPSLAATYADTLQNFDPKLMGNCQPTSKDAVRLPLDVVMFELCRKEFTPETGGAVVLGGKLRSPIEKFKDSQMGMFYRDRGKIG